jgi:hypothetical protein
LQNDTEGKMESYDQCIDCQRWGKTYEMATVSYFKLRSQFQIASLCDDPESVQKIVFEINSSRVRIESLREAGQKHRGLVHGSPHICIVNTAAS